MSTTMSDLFVSAVQIDGSTITASIPSAKMESRPAAASFSFPSAEEHVLPDESFSSYGSEGFFANDEALVFVTVSLPSFLPLAL